jgi:hypothetical protein
MDKPIQENNTAAMVIFFDMIYIIPKPELILNLPNQQLYLMEFF